MARRRHVEDKTKAARWDNRGDTQKCPRSPGQSRVQGAEEVDPAVRGSMDNRPGSAAGFLAHRGLIAFATAVAMAEAGLLSALAPAARALAPQVTAVPPLAVFHDLRWLYSAQRSWLEFGLLLAGLLLARSAVNALLVRLAWPSTMQPPAPRTAMVSALAFVVFACLLMSPVVSLSLGVAILPFSWPFLASVPVMLVIAVPLSHGGIMSTWWRMLPPPAAVCWLLADFAGLSVVAAFIGRLPAAGAIPVAGLAGLINARSWYGLTASVARAHARAVAAEPARTYAHGRLVFRWEARRIPLAPLATITAIAVVIAVTRLAFLANAPAGAPTRDQPAAAVVGSGNPAPPGHPKPAGARWSRHRPVLEVPGFGSHCCVGGRALAGSMPDTLVQQFSYRGLSRGGYPLPYGPAASDLPLPVLGDRIAAQAWRLHARTGRRVDVVAESEGTLGVYAMLARHPGVPVSAVVLLSPIVAPGQVSYPVGGGRSAMVPGGELQAVVWFVGGLSPFGTSGAQTLISSVNRFGARFAAAAARHHRFRWLELVPLADAVTLPACGLPPNVLVVPAFHGALLGNPAALQMVRSFLHHRRVGASARMRITAEIVAAAATAWRIPQASTPSPPCTR